jgi:hypothetical protein
VCVRAWAWPWLRAERVVEPHLLFLESLLSPIELAEASTLPFAIVPGLRGLLANRGVWRSGLTFYGALVGVGRRRGASAPSFREAACSWPGMLPRGLGVHRPSQRE